MKKAIGEASSSRRKRKKMYPVLSFVEDQEMVTESGTLYELDLLNCPICCHALSVPIFQCKNGHIACPSCCDKMQNRCPCCALRIGEFRCRIMERVVEAIIVQCPNAIHGCNKVFSYGKELKHMKECEFALRYCAVLDCNYSGVAKDLHRHFEVIHKPIFKRYLNRCSIHM